ncbi:MAG: putative signaling protein [Pseudidiomarina mangrovi]|nr:MAG: putative signaling protein [Pseudidiomarina mangrovi]
MLRPSVVRALGALMLLWSTMATALDTEYTTIRVGVYDNPPKVMLNENGDITGIFGDLLMVMAERENWRIEPVPCRFNDCLELLRNGDIDLMPDVAINAARDADFDFHATPVLRSWSQLYSKSPNQITSLIDLEGMRVAVLQGSVQQEYLRNLTLSFGLTVQFVDVSSFAQGFRLLDQGQVDAVAANQLYGDAQVREQGSYATPVMFQPAPLHFAGNPNSAMPYLAAIEGYINTWQNDSQSPYTQVMQRWQVYASAPTPVFYYQITYGLLAVLALALGFTYLLRGQVKRQTLQLQQSEQQLNTILNTVEGYIYIKDREGRYTYANQRVASLLATTPSAIVGKLDDEFFDAQTCAHIRQNDRRVLDQGERVVDEETNKIRTGELRTFLSVKIPLRDPDGDIFGLCGISTDITEHIEIQEQLNRLAYFDSVTGLANRSRLLEHLGHGVLSYQRTNYEGALFAIDLVGFTVINDTLGHAIGDDLLRQVGIRIAAMIDETATAARLGADDFVVILEDLSDDREHAIMGARNWAKALLTAFNDPFELAGSPHKIAVNIGVTMFSDMTETAESLLKNADLALADAKLLGPGGVRFFNVDMQQNITRRVNIENALRKAIDNNGLQLYMQPQVNAAQQVIGGELLCRWHDPELGDILPSEFIPVAETTGLIIDLGDWVVRQACGILNEWQQHERLRGLSLAVNISPRQFSEGSFVPQIMQCIADEHIDPQRLELEITEGMLIKDVEQTARRMHRLADLGVKFSLDDFGTGYASLAYLRRLPLYQLKIDQSFVRELLLNKNDEIIISSILGLGRSLALEVIAEGVETHGQAKRLQEMGCAKFQGFYFGRPAPILEWQERLLQSLHIDYVG